MRESIEMPVIIGDEEGFLTIYYEDDVVEFYLEGEELCRASYEDNVKHIIHRMLEIWR